MRYSLLIVFSFFFSSLLFAQTSDTGWPIFRGKPDLTGMSDSEFPSSPHLSWSYATNVRTKSSPVISDGVIFFGNDKGSLIAVTPEGKVKWKYESGDPIESAPLVFGKRVIFGSNNGTLRALDKFTGNLLWSYATENQIAGSANGWVSGKKSGIVVGSYDYYLHCVDPENGRALWKVETENYVNGTPAILNGKIVFGGCDGMMRVVDQLTGAQKDTVNIGVYIPSSPCLVGDLAYFGDYDGTLYCVNIKTKKIVWEVAGPDDSGSIMAIPACGNSEVIIGREDKYMYCYATLTGKLLWKFRTNGRITGSAVMTPTKVLFTSLDGNVYITGSADGKKIWSFNTGSPVSSSPAVSDGRFYILTDDGRLLAFEEKQNVKK